MKCLSCFKNRCSWVPQRYFFAVYLLIGFNVYFWIRVSVILALAEMTFPLEKATSNTTGREEYCPVGDRTSLSRSKAEFSWDQPTQHLILQGFYYGYVVSNLPGGILADRVGGKTVLGMGVLVSSIVALLLPTLARLSPYLFFLGRVVQGLGQGVVFPSMTAMIAKWAPPNERATIVGITSSGIMLGNASAFIVTSFVLANTPTWAEVFYINGALGFIWLMGWFVLVYSSPAQHPFVSDNERDMIETMLARNTKHKPKRVPWGKILTSLPVYAAVMAHYGHLWAIFTMVNEMPQYLSKVIHFDIKHSGFYSGTPHLAMIPTALGAGYVCDWLVKRGIMSLNFNRKLFIFLCNALPVPFLVAASFAGCDKISVVVLFAIMMFFKGLAYPTLKAQPVDLCPHYAGTLMGILESTGSIAGFVSPMTVPLFLTGDGSLGEWRKFFILSGCIMIVTTLPFWCIGSAEVQPWNSVAEEEQPAEESGGRGQEKESGQKEGGQKEGGQKEGGQKEGGQKEGGQKEGGQKEGGQKKIEQKDE